MKCACRYRVAGEETSRLLSIWGWGVQFPPPLFAQAISIIVRWFSGWFCGVWRRHGGGNLMVAVVWRRAGSWVENEQGFDVCGSMGHFRLTCWKSKEIVCWYVSHENYVCLIKFVPKVVRVLIPIKFIYFCKLSWYQITSLQSLLGKVGVEYYSFQFNRFLTVNSWEREYRKLYYMSPLYLNVLHFSL